MSWSSKSMSANIKSKFWITTEQLFGCYSPTPVFTSVMAALFSFSCSADIWSSFGRSKFQSIISLDIYKCSCVKSWKVNLSYEKWTQNLLGQNTVEIDVNIDVNFGIHIYQWLLINISWCKLNIFWIWLLVKPILLVPWTWFQAIGMHLTESLSPWLITH